MASRRLINQCKTLRALGRFQKWLSIDISDKQWGFIAKTWWRCSDSAMQIKVCSCLRTQSVLFPSTSFSYLNLVAHDAAKEISVLLAEPVIIILKTYINYQNSRNLPCNAGSWIALVHMPEHLCTCQLFTAYCAILE